MPRMQLELANPATKQLQFEKQLCFEILEYWGLKPIYSHKVSPEYRYL